MALKETLRKELARHDVSEELLEAITTVVDRALFSMRDLAQEQKLFADLAITGMRALRADCTDAVIVKIDELCAKIDEHRREVPLSP